MQQNRIYKVVDAQGRTCNCPTHSLEEAAEALLEAREQGKHIRIKRGSGHALSVAEGKAIVQRAVEIAAEGAAA